MELGRAIIEHGTSARLHEIALPTLVIHCTLDEMIPVTGGGAGADHAILDPDLPLSEPVLAGWDALARGLREGGVEGFVDAYDFSEVPAQWRDTVEKVVRQRVTGHEHPEAVADALEVVPRSRPFERIYGS